MTVKVVIKFIAVLSVTAFALSGCYQERPSERPPIHLNPNMDNQPKYRPQAESNFFEDGATMRLPVAGTVARGELRDNYEFYAGKNWKGNFINDFPDTVKLDMQLIKRGQERFNIYCSPCHSRVGDGKGIMVSHGYLPPPTFHQERLIKMPNGQLFDIITNGVRNMPAYRFQVPVADRWAIISYIRALQRSQTATIDDVPQQIREEIK
ncbi:MAG: c-type cytochrome [Candidatus Zixiibacteriota bacterium]